jgi:polyphosphate kinase
MDKRYRLYVNRDLSWLKFNERCLSEAANPDNPPMERLNFASIFQTNLDEFFMVRVGGIHDRLLFNKNITDNKSGMNDLEQLSAIHHDLLRLLKKADRAYRKIILEFKRYGLYHLRPETISKRAKHYFGKYFDKEILPYLFPSVVGKRNKFPFLENNSIYLGTMLKIGDGQKLLGIVPLRSAFPRMVFLPSKHKKFLLIEDLLYLFADRIFSNFKVESKCIFRITRNADLDAEEALEGHEKLSYRKSMEILLKKRKRLAPVRIEFYGCESSDLEDHLIRDLNLKKEQSYRRCIPLSLSHIKEIKNLYRQDKYPHLYYPKVSPQMSPALHMQQPLIPQVKKKDLLLSYPYESFSIFIHLLREAAVNTEVESISITLYREANNSRIVDALSIAAENGKKVTVLVELRARFDESHNIDISRQLEQSGVTVLFGLEDYKVHSKLLLITSKNKSGMHYITQVGTGNYNEITAGLYADLTYITADPVIGKNAADVFTALRSSKLVKKTDHLLVSPLRLKPKVLALIEEQTALARAGKEGRLIFKLNSLSDVEIIDALIAASHAGVKIDLIIRGICCLKAGYHATRNITVRSIIGRYLEHARIYMFGQKEDRRVYISSADFMTRNTQRRVEIAMPITDKDALSYIEFYIETELADNVKSSLQHKGIYRRILPEDEKSKKINSQNEFIKHAYHKAGNKPPKGL